MSPVRVLPALLLCIFAAGSGITVAGVATPAIAGDQAANEVILKSVELVPQPMIYVTATVPMAEIPAFMGTAFAALGQFLGTSGVAPLGPPMAVYHDWHDGSSAVDVGFPVSSSDAQKATGDVLAGMTPGGHAVKVVHVGPYDDFPATYAKLEAAMKQAGIAGGSRMWEVYVNEPGATPAAELITEIYVQVSAEDAAKIPAE